MTTDYYHLLQLETSADLISIKKAFRREIAIYHPDNNKSPNARAKFDLIVEAFDVLSHIEKRRLYDALFKSQTFNKPAVIKKEKQHEEWQKEAKTKSKKYQDYGLDELLMLDLFILNGDILDELFTGTSDLLDGLTDGLEDVLDLF